MRSLDPGRRWLIGSLGLLALVLALIAGAAAQVLACPANMRQVCNAASEYGLRNGRYPRTLAELYDREPDWRTPRCPLTGSHYRLRRTVRKGGEEELDIECPVCRRLTRPFRRDGYHWRGSLVACG